MRSPRSLYSFLILSFLSLVLVKATNDEFYPRQLTNSQRLARGLPLNEPRDARKPTPRYTAQLVKRSTLPEDNTFVVTTQTTSVNRQPVKRGARASWLCVQNGFISTIDEPSVASRFAWTTAVDGMRSLQWVPQFDNGGFLEGMRYNLTLLGEDAVLTPQFVSYAITPVNLFPTSLDAVLSPKLQTTYSSTALDFLWIVDTNGRVHFAMDVATAVEQFPGSSIAIAQTGPSASAGDVGLALQNRDKALTSRGKLYVLKKDGTEHWVTIIHGNTLGFTNSEDSGIPFFFPYLGSTSSQKILYEDSGLDFTVIRSDETSSSSNFAVMEGSTVAAQFGIPSKGKGVVTPLENFVEWSFFANGGDLVTCSSQADCAALEPICVELVPNGRKPFACAEIQPQPPVQRQLHVTHLTGTKKGYLGVNSQGIIEWITGSSTLQPSTFVVPSPADSATTPLGIIVGGEEQTVRLAKNTQGQPSMLTISTWPSSQYQKPYWDSTPSAFVTVSQDGFILTSTGQPFDSGYSSIVDCEGNNQCTTSSAYRDLCIEAVPIGGLPSKCAAQMAARIPFNARKIFAATKDGSFSGWLQVDSGAGVFKAVAQDKTTASPFYAPYLGNGSVNQELFAAFNDGYGSWWGQTFYQRPSFTFLGYYNFGAQPGNGGATSGLPFHLGDSAVGLLTPSQDWNNGRYNGYSFYYNPTDKSLALASTSANAVSMGVTPICLEILDANDSSMPSVCRPPPPKKRGPLRQDGQY